MIRAFITGVSEFRMSSWTTGYANYKHQEAYDWGREWAHRLTLRRYEPF